MLDMLCSYKETKKMTVAMKKSLEEPKEELEKRLNEINEQLKTRSLKEEEIHLLISEREGIREELAKIENDISSINSILSDLTFTIDWLSTGSMPGAIRGIERQSAYKREVPFDSKWLDLMIDNKIEIYELNVVDEEVEEMKRELVNDLKKCLTDKQLEVFKMLSQGLDRATIAKMLGISRQAVHELIIRGRRNIKNAGWMMV